MSPQPVSGMLPPFLSLVMCTIGETDRLPRLAASLVCQTRRDFELIVVDQSPPGRLDEFLALLPEWLDVQVVRSARGLSRARNVGLRHCRAGWVALPDDDAWYDGDLVEQLAVLFDRHTEYAVLTGVTRDEHGRLSNGAFLSSAAEIGRGNVWRCGNSNGVFFRREAAQAVGGFDETLGVGSGTLFGAGEETDFILRILASGRKGRFLPDLVVRHDQVHVRQDAAHLAKARLYAQGYGRLLRLHGYGVAYLTWRLFRNAVAAVLAGFRLQGHEVRRRLIWLKGMTVGYTATFPDS
ncbi:glycosyltransferase [Phenylobacterium sp.]|uniref:glycosyltransferase family 2 protein n=1 Tax=Phenylobacterium sp. TaxID=1871053 RepID=UPI00262DE4CB|nr:glycosyltransferase [Phenylobacterium sp.]